MKKLSSLTDASTNVGFLKQRKKFHWLLATDKFRLKSGSTLMNESFIIKGVLRSQNNDLIDVEYVRRFMLTSLPTFLLIIYALFLASIGRRNDLDIRYIPFIIIWGLLLFWILDVKRTSEIEKIKKLFSRCHGRPDKPGQKFIKPK